ncbi:ectonucleotide pyrophosphatase/phosphodiesterase family member 7-like [Saccoglossus kowalevskii]
MKNEGVKAEYVTPVFVTLTLPSHFTIVTGLWAESHGVIHNIMYDPIYNETLTSETRNESKWWDMGAEPIWQTARFQNKTSGSYFYYGGDVEIKGLYPNVYIGHPDPEVPWENRVDTVMEWLSDYDIDVVTLYFDEPDHTGHYDGPDSDERRDMVVRCDNTLGYLRDQIEAHGLTGVLNVIITSDHGMSEINDEMKIELYDYVEPNDLYHVTADYGPVALIEPKNGKLNTVFDALKDAHPNMTVFMKEDIPERLHYRDHYRILSLFAYSDRPWEIATRWEENGQVGGHGFDNEDLTMKNIFLASGPDFKKGFLSKPFESVDIYPLMCQILNLQPAPNNGSLDNVIDLLNLDASGVSSKEISGLLTLVCLVIFFNI